MHLTDRSPAVLEIDLTAVADINPLVPVLTRTDYPGFLTGRPPLRIVPLTRDHEKQTTAF